MSGPPCFLLLLLSCLLVAALLSVNAQQYSPYLQQQPYTYYNNNHFHYDDAAYQKQLALYQQQLAAYQQTYFPYQQNQNTFYHPQFTPLYRPVQTPNLPQPSIPSFNNDGNATQPPQPPPVLPETDNFLNAQQTQVAPSNYNQAQGQSFDQSEDSTLAPAFPPEAPTLLNPNPIAARSATGGANPNQIFRAPPPPEQFFPHVADLIDPERVDAKSIDAPPQQSKTIYVPEERVVDGHHQGHLENAALTQPAVRQVASVKPKRRRISKLRSGMLNGRRSGQIFENAITNSTSSAGAAAVFPAQFQQQPQPQPQPQIQFQQPQPQNFAGFPQNQPQQFIPQQQFQAPPPQFVINHQVSQPAFVQQQRPPQIPVQQQQQQQQFFQQPPNAVFQPPPQRVVQQISQFQTPNFVQPQTPNQQLQPFRQPPQVQQVQQFQAPPPPTQPSIRITPSSARRPQPPATVSEIDLSSAVSFQTQATPPPAVPVNILSRQSPLAAQASNGKGKKLANDAFLACCRGKKVAKSCERICNFDVLNKKTLTGMFLGTDPCPQSSGLDLMQCAADNNDHTDCCRNRDVHKTSAGDKCLGFCDMRPGQTFQADVSYLPCWSVLNHIKQCFKENLEKKVLVAAVAAKYRS